MLVSIDFIFNQDCFWEKSSYSLNAVNSNLNIPTSMTVLKSKADLIYNSRRPYSNNIISEYSFMKNNSQQVQSSLLSSAHINAFAK